MLLKFKVPQYSLHKISEFATKCHPPLPHPDDRTAFICVECYTSGQTIRYSARPEVCALYVCVLDRMNRQACGNRQDIS